ncbi:MAG: hypothetical protein RBR81_07225 [Bacteroidales bacterium]|jgi:hypothetical protein|nr:hypothetical protein [Bacteroidales bacterium]
MKRYLDAGSITVISMTFILFVLALFTKGMTHDLLLEAGVLLVSVKLIMMAYRTGTYYQSILGELKDIKEALSKKI